MTTATRQCRFCKDRQRRETMLITPQGAFCNAGHALQWAQDNADRMRQKRLDAERKAYKAETRKLREKHNATNLKWQVKETQRAFNELVRLIDEGKPCISCGRMKCGASWDAGHFLTVGGHPALRFDPRNCYLQGSACNRAQEKYRGTYASVREGFENGIVERHGMALLLWLKGPHQAKHYICPELADLRALFRAEIRYIKKHSKPSRDWRALDQEEVRAA